MSTRDQRICLWLTVVFGVLLAIAFSLFPGFFPPMSPTMSAQEVADFYRANVGRIRTSMIALNILGITLIPFFMLIVGLMKRMANSSAAFAYSYFSAAVSGATLFALANLAWLIAAFRPDRDPQLIQLLNDFAWFAFVTPVGMIMAQNLCLALGIYLDDRTKPVFPRWIGHFNIVTALLMAPSAFAMMFKTGPLAWDGFLAFWLRFGTFALYLLVMLVVAWLAVDQQIREEERLTSS